MSSRLRLGLILGVALVCATVLAYAVFRVVAVPRGPLRGRAAVELTLAAVERFNADDAPAMVARLEALGARASIVTADDARVVLRVEETTTADAVTSALRPLRFAVHQRETVPAHATFPDGVVRPEPSRFGATGPCEALEAWVRSPGPGCHAALERVAPDECAAHCLVDPPVLTRERLVDVTVRRDPVMGEVLDLTLDTAGASSFAAFTTAHVGEHLAITVDDVVWSAPRIASPIPGGRLMLPLPEGEDAETLARVLRAPGEISAWTLEQAR